jgi:hypothetical protein
MKKKHVSALAILVLLFVGLQLSGCVTFDSTKKAELGEKDKEIAKIKAEKTKLTKILTEALQQITVAEAKAKDAQSHGHEATISDFKAARLAAEKARAEFAKIVNDFLTTDKEVTVEALKKLGLDPAALVKLQKGAAAAKAQRQKEAAAGFPQSSGKKK